MRFKKRKAETADVNMTPMLDIVFILLIFFIVTASFINFRGMDMTRGPDCDCPAPPSRVIVVMLDEANQAWIEGQPYRPVSVASVIERHRAEDPSRKVVLQIHPEASHWAMIRIRDDLESRKINNSFRILDDAREA